MLQPRRPGNRRRAPHRTLLAAPVLLALVGGSSAAQDGGVPPPAPAPAAKPVSPTDVLVVVNGTPVTRGAFWRYLERMLGESYLEIFINEKLVEQEAARFQIVATREKETAWIEDKIRQFRQQPQVKTIVEKGGYDYDELRRQYRPHARMGYLLETLIRKRRSKIDAVRRLYERRFGERRRARHILYRVAPPAGASDEARAALDREARSKAERAAEMLKRGVEFSDLARRESEDPGSAARGGMLPAFGRADMVKAFADVAFALKKGEISRPVRSTFGWHVIRIVEVFAPARPFDDAVRAELRKELSTLPVDQAELDGYLKELRQKAKIERMTP